MYSESVWEAPKEGFVKLEGRGTGGNKGSGTSKSKVKSKKPEEKVSSSTPVFGPVLKSDPFGQWENAHK